MTRMCFVVSLAGLLLTASPVVRSATAQMDDHFRRQPAETGGVIQAFGVDTHPDGPLEIVDVMQIRQAHGRHRFAVTIRNRSSEPVASYVVIGAVVSSDGSIKATQPLPPVKNLKAGQSRRQEFDLRVTVLSLSDRLAFALSEVHRASGEPWKLSDEDLRASVKAVARSVPQPR